ncbi:MAG: hypothetical protein V4654_10320 [Bdellovibrionota bacterium]
MIKFISRLYLIFVLLVSLSTPIFAQRIGDSREKWQMLTTPHFEIFYSAEHHDLGLYYSRIAELSYAEIMTIFTVAPKEKIVVILNDSTDAPNGFATLLPYPYMMIYPVQAGRDDALSESAEWAKELFVHELAHIFQLYPAEDYYKFAKPFFGSIIAPNLLLPLWWKEGMAVEIESRFTHQGRTRSYFQDAGIRALVLEKKLFSYTLAEANEMLPTWPYGGRPYLFGSMLMGDIGAKDQGKAINDLTLGHASRLPYFIETPHERIFGNNYESHYLLTLDTYQRQAEDQINQLNTVSATTTTAIDPKLISGRHPRFNTTGTTLGIVSLDKKGKKVSFYNFDGETKKWNKQKFKKSPTGDISSFEFHPYQNKIVFAKIDLVDNKRSFSDLYIFNLDEDKETQITKSARARYPIWNNQGTVLYYISTFNGKTQLKALNVATESTDQLLETDFAERLHEIALHNDRELFVGIKDNKGNIKTKVFDLATHTLSDLKFSAPEVEHLKYRFGKVYFTSVKNGVPNIYQYKNEAEETPVSHLLTGALDFDVNKDNLAIATIHTAGGFAVHSFDLQVYKSLPKISNRFRDRYNYIERPTPEFEATTENAKALKYLYPHYWIPFVATSSANNSVFFQAVTGSQDPLLIHRYNLAVDYDSYIKKMGYDFDYVNAAFNWPFTFSAQRNFKPIGNTKIFIERSDASLGVIPDTFKISSKLLVNAGLQFSEVDQSDLRTQHAGPYLQVSYKSIQQTAFDIYPTSGWGAFIQLENQKSTEHDAPDFLGSYDQATGSLLGYNSLWLPDDHSMYGKLNFLHTLQKVSSRFGTSNAVLPTLADSTLPDFVLRGYGSGQFFGSRMATLNTEYRFPLETLNKGSGTYLYYLKRVNGAVVVDGLTVSGGAFDKDDVLKAENMSRSFWSAGAEIRLETTLGYLLPVNFIFGYYRPLSPQYAKDDAQFGFSLQLGGGIPGRQSP